MRHSFVSSTVLFIILLWAFTINASTSVEQNASADLLRQLPADEILQLTAQQQEFMLLQRENMTSYTKGTVILLPDASEHPASPKYINLLRQQLTDYGWYTLALMPPSLPVVITSTLGGASRWKPSKASELHSWRSGPQHTRALGEPPSIRMQAPVI